MKKITDLSALELRDAVMSGDITACDAVQAFLDAIEAHDAGLNSFNEVYADQALKRAREIDSRLQAGEDVGSMAGVPIALKDNICTAWGKTTCSSKMLEDFHAPYTATEAGKLNDAGAIVIGKTNMDEFAMGSSTENSHKGPSRNPWDLERVPGGSSGGSASALAGGLCAAALGSDTGGSIRQPAAFCGIVGMKPTYGRVSRYGLVAYGSSLDQIGPMTRDVRDCALIMNVIAGGDRSDSTCIDAPVPDYLQDIDRPMERLRVGLPREFFSQALNSEIHRAIEKAGAVYESMGAELVDVSLPHSRIDTDEGGKLSSYAVACYYIIATAEASSNLARYDGVHYGHRTTRKCGDIVELYSASRAEGFGDEVKRRILLGTYALSSGYYDAYYLKALKVRRLIKNDFDRAFESCDVLLCPTTPSTAFALGEKTQDPLAMYLADIYTISVNLAGVPAVSIPAGVSDAGLPISILASLRAPRGVSDAGLPIGMQLIGPVFGEQAVLRSARMFEMASGTCRLRPQALGGKQQ